jgi:long-chain acyl-CoA synthetase
MTIKRLFDCLDHQLQHFPKQDMLAAKENGQWVTYGTQQVADIVNRFSAGLLQLGVSGNDMTPAGSDKIAIISNNRPEWIFTDMAVQQLGAILVPVYPTTNPIELEFILNDAAVKYIFVSNEELLQKIKNIAGKVPSIQNIYTFDKIAGAAHWSEVTAMANEASLQQVNAIKQTVPATHLATIIYTSGTTGTPKGVMLSHKNIYTNVQFSKGKFSFRRCAAYKGA